MSKHGHADWGVYAAKDTLFTLQDLAELVARLGGISVYDRAGDLVWGDGFEDGVRNWEKTLAPTGGAIALSTDYARSGAYAMKLLAGTGLGGATELILNAPPLVESGYGLEVSFLTLTLSQGLTFMIDYYNGVNKNHFEVNLNLTAKTLQIWDHDLGIILLDSALSPWISDPTWHTLKVVVDLKTKAWKRLCLDAASYNLAAYTADRSSNTGTPRVETTLHYGYQSAANPPVYMDDVIITQNEP